jgi:flagellar hook-associated protein 3 FlgL
VRTALDEVSAMLDRVTLASTVVGARLGWMDTLDSRLKDESLSQAKALSQTEDLDFAKAIGDYQQLQTAYQATLATSAKLLQLSLLDFLK